MALVGNGVRLATSNPLRCLGGANAHTTDRANWGRHGASRNLYAGDATVVAGASIANKNAIPDGYRPPYCWVPQQKPGGMASRGRVVGTGTVSGANLAGGLNAEASLAGVGTITNADGIMIWDAIATLAGVGLLTADITAVGDAGATLLGTGTLTADMLAAILAEATLSGTGTLTADMAGVLSASASLSGAGAVNADILGLLEAAAALSGSGSVVAAVSAQANLAATLAGQGDIVAALSAIGEAVATLTGTGAIASADLRGKGEMSAEITTVEALSPTGLAAAVWNALAANFNTALTMGAKVNAAASAGDPWGTALPGVYADGTAGAIVGEVVYTAKALLFKASSTDVYVVSWFANGVPITAGITLPLIQVVDVTTGLDLIASTAMTEIGALQSFRLTTATRTTAGTPVLIRVSATIAGDVRTWDQPMGRDA